MVYVFYKSKIIWTDGVVDEGIVKKGNALQ